MTAVETFKLDWQTEDAPDFYYADHSWWLTLYVAQDEKGFYFYSVDHDAGVDEHGELYSASSDRDLERYATWQEAAKAAEEHYL